MDKRFLQNFSNDIPRVCFLMLSFFMLQLRYKIFTSFQTCNSLTEHSTVFQTCRSVLAEMSCFGLQNLPDSAAVFVSVVEEIEFLVSCFLVDFILLRMLQVDDKKVRKVNGKQSAEMM